MTALTAAYDAKRKDGRLTLYPLGAGVKVYKGALVAVLTATGFVQPAADTAGTAVVGVAAESADNTTGGAGAKSVRVEKSGLYTYSSSGAAQTDVGKTAFVVDDNTVKTAATTNSIPAGVVAGYGSATSITLRIDGKVS